MRGDDLTQVVRWKGGSDPSRFKGKQLVVRLEVSRVQLFALEIQRPGTMTPPFARGGGRLSFQVRRPA